MKYARTSILMAALLLAACDEATRPVAPYDSAKPVLADADLPELAQAVARGLADPAARRNILAAMRASHAVEHRLILADYLRSPEGAGLLEGASQTFGLGTNEVLAHVDRLRQVAEVVITVPLREHRLNWRGSADVGVAGTWNSDALEFVVYEPDGHGKQTRTVEELGGYDAFFLVRPQESWGTRIDRQPEGPGPVIQDPNDGERAVVWTYEEEGKPPVSVDYGLYDSDEALVTAVATAMGLPTVAACDSHNPAVAGGCTGGGGGTDPQTGTFLDSLLLKVRGDRLGTAEVEVTVGYRTPFRVHVRGTHRETGVSKGIRRIVQLPILPVAPRRGGPMFYASAVETDPWWAGGNDDLGYSGFQYNEEGIDLYLRKINIWLSW